MSGTLSALRLKSGVHFARPRPETEGGRSLLAALDAILAIDAGAYADTVALAKRAYRAHEATTPQDEREEALRWFWSSAQPTRWEARLLDGWQYDGEDWHGFNATLMDAGAIIAPEASFPAICHLLQALPAAARADILDRRWAYLRERGLNVNANDPDAPYARSLLEAFGEHPEAVALLLNRMDADPLQAYARMRALRAPRALKALELLEDKLGLDDTERVTRAAAPEALRRSMARLRA